MVWIENQARVCHSNSVPSLGASYGRGAATMTQWDLANSDCVLVMGSNMAEAHPIAFRFVLQEKERGATVIPVVPRFTRPSALSHIHAHIRPDWNSVGEGKRFAIRVDLGLARYLNKQQQQ